MTPKEKAKQLYELTRYDVSTLKGTEALINEVAKRCALIAVDEILNLDLHSVGDYKCFDDPSEWYISYWEEVKHEIKKL